MGEDIEIETLTGEDIASALSSLARLRIEVFFAYPYLYQGDLAYEETYLRKLAAARDSVIVTARTQEGLVGCATGSALDDGHEEFVRPLIQAGIDPSSTFYFGESVLLPGYRGQGVGHAFFDRREAHARSKGYKRACFCAVIRPEGHPMRPADYSPLDAFWMKRGYAPVAGAIAHFSWRDIGEVRETEKPMQVWLREFG